jgi:putative transposase
MKTPTKTTAHSVYNLNYHIVLVTKYRNKVLTGQIEQFVKEQVPIICQRYDWEALALEVMPEHVHLFVSAPPTTAPNTIAKTLKSILAVAVFREFTTLKRQRFWGSGLWSDGCYYGSAGAVSSETIKHYIENQKDT